MLPRQRREEEESPVTAILQTLGLIPKSKLVHKFRNEKDDAENGDDEDDDDDDDERELEETNEELLQVITELPIRKRLLDEGVDSSLLALDLSELFASAPRPPLERLKTELVSFISADSGKQNYLFALKPQHSGDGQSMKAIKQVLTTLSRLKSGHLSAFSGAADVDNHVVVCITTARGASLKRLSQATFDQDVIISPSLQLLLASDLADGVLTLHSSGIAHGALRPAVVVVSTDPGRVSSQLLFWDISTRPSQVSFSQDIFDLGVIYSNLVLGRVVIADDLPPASSPSWAGINESFRNVIFRMTNRDSSLRPSAREVVEAVRAILTDEQIDEELCRNLESTTPFGSASDLYELKRPPSPLFI